MISDKRGVKPSAAWWCIHVDSRTQAYLGKVREIKTYLRQSVLKKTREINISEVYIINNSL
jgi:hypothetical protein